jgi:hypothetical protein
MGQRRLPASPNDRSVGPGGVRSAHARAESGGSRHAERPHNALVRSLVATRGAPSSSRLALPRPTISPRRTAVTASPGQIAWTPRGKGRLSTVVRGVSASRTREVRAERSGRGGCSTPRSGSASISMASAAVWRTCGMASPRSVPARSPTRRSSSRRSGRTSTCIRTSRPASMRSRDRRTWPSRPGNTPQRRRGVRRTPVEKIEALKTPAPVSPAVGYARHRQ